MNNIFQFLFTVRHDYDNPIEQQRARGLLIMNWVLLLASLAAAAFIFYPANYSVVSNPLERLLEAVITITPVGSILIHLLLKNGGLKAATWLFVTIQIGLIGVVSVGSFFAGNALLLVIPLVAAATLVGRRGILLVFFMLTMFVLIAVIVQSRIPVEEVIIPAARWQLDLFVALLSLGLATLLLYVFNGLTQNLTRETLREVVALRQIARFAGESRGTTEESIYAEAVQFIRNKLDYPFAQIFYTAADGNRLNRRMRVGLGVRTSSEQSADINIADGSAINEAASTLKPVVVSNDDAALRWSHFLPSTTYGVALPILHQQKLLAVLDVQTEQNAPFSSGQISALQSLADSIGVTAAHYRLVDALRQNIRQQEEVTATLRARLQEMRQATTGGISGSWEGYLQQRGQELFGFNLEDSQGLFIAAEDLPDTLRPVMESGALQITTQGDLKVINIPISLRGEILGAMSFSVPRDHVITERQIETAQIVANRLALALENKRLFEQTQATALRERKANEATNLLISATNVEAVINVAAASFNDALGAINTRIHLQPSLISEPRPKEEFVP